jgi:opacity protein-like surface antigen
MGERKKMKPSWNRLALCIAVFVVAGSVAMAQDQRFEIGANFGYTFSEGVDINQFTIPDGTVTKVNPVSSSSWGLNADYLITENVAVGFLFDQQMSKLNVDMLAGGNVDIADLDVYNYHGTFTYNFGEGDSPIRPYLFGGLGATHYDGGEFLYNPGLGYDVTGSLGSETKFSMVWGGGVKFFFNKNVGVKGEMRWTPTYIKSDPAGIWCGWYGCWVVGDTDYSNQLKLSGGVVFRF